MAVILTGQDLMQFKPVPAINPRCWPCLSIAATSSEKWGGWRKYSSGMKGIQNIASQLETA
eukprot:5978195-Amphidinium_carterae.1